MKHSGYWCKSLTGVILLTSATLATFAHAQSSRFDELANAPFTNGFLSKDAITSLNDELLFQRAVQSYLWALRRSSTRLGNPEILKRSTSHGGDDALFGFAHRDCPRVAAWRGSGAWPGSRHGHD
jgi:hypothetical protein